MINPEDLNPFDPQREDVDKANLKTKEASDAKFARDTLENRKGAYIRVFVAGTPSADDRKIVMADLHRFCRQGATAFHPDERIHVLLTGRQEVTLRIDDFTRKSVDELLEQYADIKE